MAVIYCSKKFGDLLGKEWLTDSDNSSNNLLGDWNGHFFNYKRKKCLLFINNFTYYSILLPPLKKVDLRNFKNIFLQRLLQQLIYDGLISDTETLFFLQKLLPITLSRTNNDKKTIGTLNGFIFRLKTECERTDFKNEDIHIINGKLNYLYLGPGRAKKGRYGMPVEDMKILINNML